MKALSGVDGVFLHLETRETPMHVASLHRFDLPAGYRGDFHANVKRQIARRLYLAPIFTRKLAPMPLQFANPVWGGAVHQAAAAPSRRRQDPCRHGRRHRRPDRGTARPELLLRPEDAA
jgi:hypothetical protein